MSPDVRTDAANIAAVARREFVTRAATRGFVISTLILVLAAVAVGLAPVVVGFIDRNSTEKVAVYVGAADLRGDPVATLDALLNAPSEAAPATGSPRTPGRRTTPSGGSPTSRPAGRPCWAGRRMPSWISSATPPGSPCSRCTRRIPG